MNFVQKIKRLQSKREKDFHEFRPILSEIEEKPLNPLGNFIFWTIIIFILTAALWMYFGRVDVVVTARGIIIPEGEEKIVQSLDKGVLTRLYVKEGQYVKKGDTVAIIQPAEYEPELELKNLDEEQVKINAELSSARARLNIANKDLARLRPVLDIIPKARYDETLKEAAVLNEEIRGHLAALAQIQNKKVQIERQRQILKSPTEGYIGQVFLHTEGAVASAGEKIVTVVPKDAKLKIKAKVLNRDIGHIKEGMSVSIKVDTYDFQKYGMFEGKVETILPSSIEDKNLGDIYETYIAFNPKTPSNKGKEQDIKTGMTTTNEINVGKRRIIEFFIYPLVKHLDESIKVR